MESASAGTRRLVITAVLIAISIVLSIPLNMGPFISLGFISFGTIAITIMIVPAIIGAVLEGPVVGAIVGGAFGLFSLFLASQQPAGSPNAIFVDPIISVLPRLFIGPAAWAVYQWFKQTREYEGVLTLVQNGLRIGANQITLQEMNATGSETSPLYSDEPIKYAFQLKIRRFTPEYICLSWAAVTGTLTNTLLVIGAISWRLNVPFFPTLASVSINVVLELIVSAVIVVAVVSALRGSGSGKQGSSV